MNAADARRACRGLFKGLRLPAEARDFALHLTPGTRERPAALSWTVPGEGRAGVRSFPAPGAWREAGGSWIGRDAQGRRIEPVKRFRFRPADWIGVPMGDWLELADRLYPIAEAQACPSRVRFVFRRPVPWPLFAALDVAFLFQPSRVALAQLADRWFVPAVSTGHGSLEAELS